MANKLLLNYYDAVIYESDLSLLEYPTAWLNDATINFRLTRLQHNNNQHGDRSDGSVGKQSDLFLDPSVISYLMHQCDEEDEDFVDEVSNMHQAWDLSSTSHKRVFVPINDQFNASRTAFAKPGGGSHWSLLLWTITRNTSLSMPSCSFYHFDSSSGYNKTAALAVSQKLLKVLHCRSKSDLTNIDSINVNECKTPQQNNAYDCGVYLLGFAEALSSVKDDLTSESCKEKYEETVSSYAGGDEFAVKLRQQICDDIRTLSTCN